MNGTGNRGGGGGGGGEAGAGKVARDYVRVGVRSWELALRAAALGLTLVAAVVLGTDKQTTIVPFQVSPSLPPLNVPVTAKWHYLSALLYFVVANAVACAYAAVSLIVLLCSRGGKTAAVALITISDILMVALLFSGCSAALTVGVLGREGNSHVKWNKVCNVFGRFCDRVAIAAILSLVGSLGFILLAALAVLGLRRRPN